MTQDHSDRRNDRRKDERRGSSRMEGGRGSDGRRSSRSHDGGDRRHQDGRKSSADRGSPSRYRGRDGGRSNRDDGKRRDQHHDAPEEQKLTIPSTPEKILFKGIDCEVNGRNDLAMVLYLHGAVRMSGGCESNALRMLRAMGPTEFPSARGRAAKSCGPDEMVMFDYLCSTLDESYDRTSLNDAAYNGSIPAIYCRIRLGDVEADDPCIDLFFSGLPGNEEMVEEGLKLLVRKKGSEKAAVCLKKLESRRKRRQSMHGRFSKAMKGDQKAVADLRDLSAEFPEAGFLLGYVEAYGEGNGEQYLRSGMREFGDTIVAMCSELGISDTPYGKYLAARKVKVQEGEWIQPMINAFYAGCDDALEDLRPVMSRNDVRKGVSNAYLQRRDAEGLVRCFDGEDYSFLENYCAGDPTTMIEVGKLMNSAREIDWLKRCYRNGFLECRDALIKMSSDEGRKGKILIYALHDVEADMDAAKLYMDMYGDPSIPSVKWLGKVCADDEVKDYVRGRFEELGDLRTFESIFVDDGYDRKRSDSRSRGKGGFKKKGGNRRR